MRNIAVLLWEIIVKSSVKKVSPTEVKISITADSADLDQALEAARKEIAQQVNIPGFRKGHVPPAIIDSRLGFAAVLNEALNPLINTLYQQAVEQEELSPLDAPTISIDKVPTAASDRTPVTFTADVEVRPELKVPDPSKLTITVPSVEVSDKDINERLDAMRSQLATLEVVDRPAKKGDVVTLNLSASIDGEVVDDQKNLSYKVGAKDAVKGLNEAIIDLSAGESTSFESNLIAGPHKGEKAVIKVTVTAVKKEKLPKLDDEFAKEVSEFDTLAELKNLLAEQAQQNAQVQQANQARDLLLEALEKDLEIPIPSKAAENLLKDHIETEEKRSGSKVSAAEQKKMKQEVEKQLRDQMLLDQIIVDRSIGVSEEELTQYLAAIAQQYGLAPAQFISTIVKNNQVGSAMADLGHQKALISAMRAAHFVDESGKPIDFSAIISTDEEEQELLKQKSLAQAEPSVQAAAVAAAAADQLTQAKKTTSQSSSSKTEKSQSSEKSKAEATTKDAKASSSKTPQSTKKSTKSKSEK